MSKMYFILSVLGWTWFVIAALFLVIRLNIKLKARQGFDVLTRQTDETSAARTDTSVVDQRP